MDNKFLDNGNCLLSCDNGYFTDSLNNKICKCSSNIKCKACNDESIGYDLCISCNDDYYPKENDSSNNLSYINCYNNLEGYYLDNNTIYKKCYSTCKSCNEKGDETNNNCIECIDNYIFINDSEIKTNCYEKCEYYYYFDSSNKYHCTETNECPNEYKILIKEKNKCINICKNDKDYKYEFNNTCYKNCPDETFPSFFICEYKSLINNKVSEECNPEKLFNNICGTFNMSSSYKDKMINDIQKEISNGTIKIFSLIDNNGKAKDLLAKEDKILYQVTTSFNQFVIKYNFTSTIDLRKCEDILREIYLIDPNIPLFILKIEKYQEGYYIPIIEYEVYNPINGEKLNLNYCNQTTIYITIPVTINEDILFKHNISSPYYNDQCNRYTSRNNTDIILKDRRNDYIENNMFLCEKNCILNSYNYTTKKVICECKAKTIFTLYSNNIFDKDKFLTKFTDIKTSSNLGVIFCYKLLFTKDGLKLNIGSYIQISIIFIHIILLFLFCIKGFKIFKNIISKIISGKEKLNNKNIINNENNIKIENNNNGENSKNIITKIKRENPNNPIKKIKYKKKQNNNNLSKINELLTSGATSNDKSNSHKILKSSDKNLSLLNIPPNNNNNSKIRKIKKKIIVKIKFNDNEMNSLSYEKALKYDKRNYLQYYLSLLRTKHLLIFTFCNNNDYNSMIIKICLLFFSFSLYFTVNTLFFTDNTMHKIYEDEGRFDFIYQIPQIFYSTAISTVINIIIKYLSLSERNIIELKKAKINYLNQKSKNILKCLKIKFFFFFIFSFLFLSIFWYYVSCFCAVYINTQLFLIKDTLISFSLTLIYPFFINLLPGIFRIISLNPKNNRENLYKFSQLLQKI